MLDLSWIEMTKLVPSLLMRFEIDLANPNEEPEQHCWYVLCIEPSTFEEITEILQVVRQASRFELASYSARA